MNFWNNSGWENMYKVIGAVVFWYMVFLAIVQVLSSL